MLYRTLLFFVLLLITPTHANGSLVVNEIMYNPEGNDTKREWVELKNTGPSLITIKDWRINDGTNHQIKNDIHPEYFSILPNEHIILASDITTFLNEHPGFEGKVFDTVLNLRNTGNRIVLLDNNKVVVDDITYQPSSGGDGNGKTIERSSDTTALFHESSQTGGTPGRENGQTITRATEEPIDTTPPTNNASLFKINELQDASEERSKQYSNSIVSSTTARNAANRDLEQTRGIIISEFLPNPSKDKDEWIELYNTNDASTTLMGWRLKDNSSHEYVFKDLVLAPNTFFTISQYDSKIHINNNGDELSLINQKGDLISKIMFQGKAPRNKSFARRRENDWAWTTKPTPGETNIIIAPSLSEKKTKKEFAHLNEIYENAEQSPPTFFNDNIFTPLLSVLIGLMFTVITVIFIKKFL